MRRTLAASFVVVASTGCRRDAAPRPDDAVVHRNPPAFEIRVLDDEECHRVAGGAPWSEKGTIVDCPESMIDRDPDGKCWHTPQIDCPPPEEATCNPPAPMPVRCPGATADAGPAIVDAGVDAAAAPGWTEVKVVNGECTSAGAVVDCPKAHTTKRSSGKCEYQPPFDCPPNAKCNPPGPHEVRCPKGL